MTTERQQLARLQVLRNDFPIFAPDCLQIRDKKGHFEPLVLNRAQIYVHERLEEQRAEKGWVRALILKGRQQGISTYIGGRFYHKSSMRKGVNVYILTHEQLATDNLFAMVDRYQRNNPFAPHVGTSNAKELVFDALESSYTVATAGTKAGGRGRTISLFHGSEAAFWPNASDHFAASLQGVPLEPETEVILESTSAGAGGEFYERYQDAEAGRGDYIAIFLPWWYSDEYAREPEADFTLETEADDGEMSEEEYAETFGLNLAQMCWRRNKIIELRSSMLFRREYPATAAEAWTAPPGHEPFIAPIHVLRARHRQRGAYGPLILGVDPASNGGDRFSIAARRGQRVLWVRHRNKIDHLEGIAWIKSLVEELGPSRVNIDAGNTGSAIITGLRTISPLYVEVVRGVNFGGTSEAKMARPKIPGPGNRRAEMWGRMKLWLEDPEGAQIPNDDALQTDLTAPKLKPKLNNDFLLESKDQMRARQVRSPDLADAVALTFAFKEFLRGNMEEKATPQFGNPDSYKQGQYAAPNFDLPVLGTSTGWMA